MKKAKLFMMLALLVMGVSNVFAQNVTISPTTGNLVAALTGQNETGFAAGWSSMWRHEQLPLTFTVADDGDLTDGGELQIPAGNICKYNGNLVIGGGQPSDLYCVLSLPKGYHITGYKMVLLNNLKRETVNNMTCGAVTNVMYETNSSFNTSGAYAQSDVMGGTKDTREHVVERSGIATNQLYFRMTGGGNSAYYYVTIKSFEVWFT